MTVLRACVTCGTSSKESYCPDKPKPWSTSRRKERRQVSGWEEQRRRERVLALYMGACHICGRKGATEVDHVVPLAEGGADDESNLAPAHPDCHRHETQAESRRARS